MPSGIWVGAVMEAANPVEAETFAHYFAKYYFVHKGFNAAIPPEAAALKQACDFVICRHNGMYFEIVCIVDREARPDARFRLRPTTPVRSLAIA